MAINEAEEVADWKKYGNMSKLMKAVGLVRSVLRALTC